MEQTAEQLRARAEPLLRERGIPRAGFYGSRVRGDHSRESDLDVLVECPRAFSLYDLIGLQHELSEALGVRAHLATYTALHPRMRDKILAEEIRVIG